MFSIEGSQCSTEKKSAQQRRVKELDRKEKTLSIVDKCSPENKMPSRELRIKQLGRAANVHIIEKHMHLWATVGKI